MNIELPQPVRISTLAIALLSVSVATAAAQVTRNDLLNPGAGAWMMYGRDYAETHFSPLSQIDRTNVGELGLDWSWEIEGSIGQLEAVPLVVDGVMYATGTWSVVFALDARTGERIWKWDPGIVRGGIDNSGPSVCCGPVNRGVAVYGDKVFVGLLDGRLVALDAVDGDVAWSVQTTPIGQDYSITGAPRVVNGLVVIGNGGAEYGVRGFVTAYDAETGEQAWRFYTVPGNPANGFESPALQMAARTWSGRWWELGGGGTVWDGMAYDQEADLLYIGVGNGSPWSQAIRSPAGGDNLFLSSIVALRAATGEYVWHYQTTPGEDWDYTATQNIILADIEIAGEVRQVLMQAPKNGFFYVMDRITGKLISAEPFAQVSWATHIDMATGRPVETREARYTEAGSWLSPRPTGAHNWDPMSFSPLTGLVYLPGQNTQYYYRRNTNFEPEPGRFNLGVGGGGPTTPAPPSPEPAGFLVAWDPATQQERWRIPYELQRNGGTMTSGGGLVFHGTRDGMFAARDDRTGDVLWETELAPRVGSPMSYELDGVQYLTILAGPGGEGEPSGRVYTFRLGGTAPMPR